MKYLLFDNNNGDANATHCYVYTHMNFLLLFCGLGARFNRVSAVTVSFFEPERLPCLVLSVARSWDFRHGLGWGLYFKLLLPPSLGLHLHFYFHTTTTRRTSGWSLVTFQKIYSLSPHTKASVTTLFASIVLPVTCIPEAKSYAF